MLSIELQITGGATCPDSAPFFGFMAIAAALVFANLGASYGTAKSAVGIASMGVMNHEAVMKNIMPVTQLEL
jgi:V-type H+-transporting ATPase proteolipid subunit